MSDVAKSYLFIPYLKEADDLIQPIYKLGWTLNYEMMFYVAFALVIGLPMRTALLVLSVGFAVLVMAGLMFAPPRGALSFWSSAIILEFVAGMWIGYALLKGIRWHAAIGAACIVAGLLILMALHPVNMISSLNRAIGYGIPAALVTAGAALGFANIRASRSVAWAAHLGDASYALYLCHPFAVRLLRLIWERTGMGVSFGTWAYIAAATITASVAAVIIYNLIEKPFTAKAQALLGAASTKQPAPSR
jgi:exopolysaccharide production protein ExoZ